MVHAFLSQADTLQSGRGFTHLWKLAITQQMRPMQQDAHDALQVLWLLKGPQLYHHGLHLLPAQQCREQWQCTAFVVVDVAGKPPTVLYKF